MARIGMVGLGAMGSPMDRNLLKVGYNLKVYDKAEAAVDALVTAGHNPLFKKALPVRSKWSSLCSAQAMVVTEVLSGHAGLLVCAKKDTLFIESSTIDVNTARVLSAEAVAGGMVMVDAPVSGRRTGC